jgi:hypothetical protein
MRMSTLTHNLTPALRRMALPEEYATARPKRYGFRSSIQSTESFIPLVAWCAAFAMSVGGRRKYLWPAASRNDLNDFRPSSAA